MVNEPLPTAPERLLALFDRVRSIALGENPLGESGITGPQLALLEWVAGAPGCGIQDLADGLGLTAPTVSVTVRRLEEAGLLHRQPDPADGRAIRLFLTDEGLAVQQRARAYRLDKMRRLLDGLAAEDQEQLLLLLERAVTAAE